MIQKKISCVGFLFCCYHIRFIVSKLACLITLSVCFAVILHISLTICYLVIYFCEVEQIISIDLYMRYIVGK